MDIKTKVNINRVSFNEMDNNGLPLQLFFNYDLNEISNNDFILSICSNHDITYSSDDITSIELCLSLFLCDDCKLEAIVTYLNGSQEWITIYNSCNADEYIEIIHSTNTDDAKEAYANYQYLCEYGNVIE